MLHAQDASTNAVAKKPRALPLRGKLEAVDNTAKTITIGKTVVNVTSDTKISKNGKPATLSDAAVGDEAAVSYRKDADGKYNAVSIRIGAKPAAAPAAPAAPDAKQ